MVYVISERQYNFLSEQIRTPTNLKYVEVTGPYELDNGKLLRLNAKETTVESNGIITIIWYIKNLSSEQMLLHQFMMDNNGGPLPRTKSIKSSFSKKTDDKGNILLNPGETINHQVVIQAVGTGENFKPTKWFGSFSYQPTNFNKLIGSQQFENKGTINFPPAEFNVPILSENQLPKKIDPFNPHFWLPVAQIAVSIAFPAIGPFIAAGIGVGDAAIYYKDGDKKTAGMMFMFSLLPGISAVAGKIPGVKELGVKGMEQLGKKITQGSTKLSQVEKQIADWVGKNPEFISSNVKTHLSKIANTKAAQTTGKVAQNLKGLATNLAGYTAAGVAYGKVYDKATQNSPENQAKREGLEWNNIKKIFGVENQNDENLLTKAWNEGWRPGKLVPEKYRTIQYKKDLSDEGI